MVNHQQEGGFYLMKKHPSKSFCTAAALLATFVVWTLAVKLIGVEAIGPESSTVSFARFNLMVHKLTGVHMSLYILTDWLSLVPIGFAASFALLGVMQWIRRKHLFKVDFSLLILGVFYVAVMAAYILFEIIVINYRPVLINGMLEASYPSSTTMLVLCIMPTAAMQLSKRVRNHALKRSLLPTITIYTLFMVIARFLSGVHWATDVIGGILLSSSLVLMYRAITQNSIN